jgi:hypothetical protein
MFVHELVKQEIFCFQIMDLEEGGCVIIVPLQQ